MKTWVCFALILAALTAASSPEKELVLSDRRGNLLAAIPVSDASRIEVMFIHSSELTPWVDRFEISGVELVLREIRMPTTGPGAPSSPEPGWTLSIENGWIVYRSVDRVYPYIDFLTSSYSPHFLTVDGMTLNFVELAGDGEVVRTAVRYTRRARGIWALRKLVDRTNW